MVTQLQIQLLANHLWETYCEIFPRLTKFDCPKCIINNNRFRTMAGRNVGQDNLVELSGKHLIQHQNQMLNVTLPHELAHQIDYNLNGGYGPRYHGANWKNIMIKIGQVPDLYHDMELK